MAITNTGIVERTITGVNDGSELFPDNTTSTATNTGIVERDVTGVHDANFVHPLGDEEIVNGDFATDSDWSMQSSWSIANGKASYNGGGNGHYIKQNASLTIGNQYIAKLDILDNSGNFRMSVDGGTASYNNYTTGNDTYSFTFVASSSEFFVRASMGFSSDTLSIDNVSVKEALVNRESTATNTGIVERSVTGVNESELWLDTESTSSVNNTGIVERSVTGINESDPMFPDNTISNIINLAGNLLVALFEAFKTRVSAGGGTLDNEVGLDIDNFDDTASLTMLPNAYKDGVLYSVLPEDGTGDFDVVRGSSATRVNKEGFIEDVRILSSNLISNGGFDTDSDWIKGIGITIDNGKANFSNSTGDLRQDPVVENGKYYKVTYTISNYVSGSVRFEIPSNIGSGIERSANGTYTEILLSRGTAIQFDARTSFTGSIDNISVKEITEDTDIPRIDYTSGSPVLLTEPQSTNLITYSEDFTQWGTIASPTITSNFGISPDGTQNADRVQMNTSDRIFINVSASGGISYSVYLKGVGQIRLRDNDGGNTKDITLTSEWVRYEFNFNDTITNIQIQQVTGASDFEIWGAQLENQSYPTSYIPTNGAIATRLADVVTGAGDVNTINSTEGVLYAEISALADDNTFRSIALSDGTINNRVAILYNDTSGIRLIVFRNNGLQVILNNTINVTDTNKIAVKYELNEVDFWINGVKVATDTNAYMPIGLNELSFSRGDGGLPFFGKTKDLRVYPTALTDAELQTLTTI